MLSVRLKSQNCLICPYESTKIAINSAAQYKYFEDCIKQFESINDIPGVYCGNVSRINTGSGIAQTLSENKAKWHKSCRREFSTDRVNRALKRHSTSGSESKANKYTRSQASSTSAKDETSQCIICSERGTKKKTLHEVTTFDIDHKMRQWAQTTQNQKLLAAIEAKYHTYCLVKLKRDAEAKCVEKSESHDVDAIEGIILAELVAYLEEVHLIDPQAAVFKLTDIVNLYQNRCKSLGLDVIPVHATRLKQRILDSCPGLDAFKKGRDVILAFKEDIGELLLASSNRDSEMIHLAKAAKAVRKDMLNMKYTFTGTFEKDCQIKAVPQSLLALIRIIILGPSILDLEA